MYYSPIIQLFLVLLILKYLINDDIDTIVLVNNKLTLNNIRQQAFIIKSYKK